MTCVTLSLPWLVSHIHLAPLHAVAGIVDALFSMLSRSRLVLGLQPRLVLSTRATPALSALVARRLISSSSCSHAEHDDRQRLEPLTSGIEDRQSHNAHLRPREFDEQGLELNPYRNGPSALDKAVHLFFFTEIIRGAFEPLTASRILIFLSRHVDCGRELLQTALHNYVPVRKRTSIPSFSW